MAKKCTGCDNKITYNNKVIIRVMKGRVGGTTKKLRELELDLCDKCYKPFVEYTKKFSDGKTLEPNEDFR